ncbi:MAG: hypothetical protein U1F66_03895 [bacterium]
MTPPATLTPAENRWVFTLNALAGTTRNFHLGGQAEASYGFGVEGGHLAEVGLGYQYLRGLGKPKRLQAYPEEKGINADFFEGHVPSLGLAYTVAIFPKAGLGIFGNLGYAFLHENRDTQKSDGGTLRVESEYPSNAGLSFQLGLQATYNFWGPLSADLRAGVHSLPPIWPHDPRDMGAQFQLGAKAMF